MTDSASSTGKRARKGEQGEKAEAAKSRFAHPTLGFGVPATTDPHHFQVVIPKEKNGTVLIIEQLGMQAKDQQAAIIDRCLLERRRWNAIRSEIQRAFNVRLKSRQLQASAWKVGVNPVDRLLGKELCVLAWAVEGMEFDHIPIAVRNWLSLRPEERWWLFGMAALCTGGLKEGGKGWRLALRHALGDIAQNEQIIQHRTVATEADMADPRLRLFE